MCKAMCFVLLVAITDCKSQGGGNFKSYYELNFKELKSTFNSHQFLNEFFDKKYSEEECLYIDTDIIVSSFLTKNMRNQIVESTFVKDKIYPLFYAKTKGIIALIYSRVIQGEYGEKEYQCWLKSFTEKGIKKDSLLLSHLADYEGRRIRIISDFNKDLQNINLKYFELNKEEDVDGNIISDTIAVKVTFKLSDGGSLLVQENTDPFVFKKDYGFSSLDKILKEYNKNCLYPLDSKLSDINNDGVNDLITLLKRKPNNCNTEEFNLIIAIGNNQGLFIFKGTQGGIDLDTNQFTIDNLSIDKNNLISFEITKQSSNKSVLLQYSYNAEKRLCFLTKADFKSSDKVETIFPEKPNMNVAQSIKLVKSILGN